MTHWWPAVKGSGIPAPKTYVVSVPNSLLNKMSDGKELPERHRDNLEFAANLIGYPLFLRTDMGAAKHNFSDTCYVPDAWSLWDHVFQLITHNELTGMFGELDPHALVVREYIPLDYGFKAFNGLPIGRERRYFVRDGVVECHHSYWPEEAIASPTGNPSIDDWEPVLAALNDEPEEEVALLTARSETIGRMMGDYWSVDFMHGADGEWYLIDMADGDLSYHWPHEGEN